MPLSQRDHLPRQLHEENLQLYQRRGISQPVRNLRAGGGGGGRGVRGAQHQDPEAGHAQPSGNQHVGGQLRGRQSYRGEGRKGGSHYLTDFPAGLQLQLYPAGGVVCQLLLPSAGHHTEDPGPALQIPPLPPPPADQPGGGQHHRGGVGEGRQPAGSGHHGHRPAPGRHHRGPHQDPHAHLAQRRPAGRDERRRADPVDGQREVRQPEVPGPGQQRQRDGGDVGQVPGAVRQPAGGTGAVWDGSRHGHTVERLSS